MNKPGSDPKVKKTLVRNCEKKLKTPVRKHVEQDAGCSSNSKVTYRSQKETALNEPTLCSSEALANYLSDIKLSDPPPLAAEDLNIDKSKINAKVTKRLNFHYNDRIYRNLIELNAIFYESKKKKGRRPTSASAMKKDLEPTIEDFSENIVDQDVPPPIPVIQPKFKKVKKVENGRLHKLVSTFENL